MAMNCKPVPTLDPAEKNRRENQETAHRRRVLLVETQREIAGAVVVVGLAQFQFAQLRNQPRPDQKTDQRRRHGGAHGAKGLRAEHTQRAEKIFVVCEVA